MADPTEIAELRRLINEPDDVTPYTDLELAARIDAAESVRQLASGIWVEKAAQYAELIDVKEGNSDRKLSQLRSQALAMATGLAATDGSGGVATARRSRTRPIERM
jgi:hypothetical protein